MNVTVQFSSSRVSVPSGWVAFISFLLRRTSRRDVAPTRRGGHATRVDTASAIHRSRGVVRHSVRYKRRWASARTSTSPASRRTRRCFDTAGWLSRSAATRSPTGRSSSRSRSRIRRRFGSAMTSNTALSMLSQLYSCQAIYAPSSVAHGAANCVCAVSPPEPKGNIDESPNPSRNPRRQPGNPGRVRAGR